jgi:gamma-glutamyltranspeptidase/glutathione hydrolase
LHQKTKQFLAHVILFAWICTPSLLHASELPIYSQEDIFHAEKAKHGIISVANKYAAEAGLTVLKEGGNAIDAAVTIAFVLAVTAPEAGNLGGGGFMMIRQAKENQIIALDYREKAPLLAHRTLFLDKNEELDTEKTRYSFLSAGVPGTVAGLALALEKYGTISFKKALEPAIKLAKNGFIVDEQLYFDLLQAKERMMNFPESSKIFYKANGEPYQVGERLVQKDLAWTLTQLYLDGPSAFYKGKIAEKIAASMRQYGGIITQKDLEEYNAVIREPVQGTYRGYDIYAMPPPSSGDVHVIELLNIIEGFPIKEWGHNQADTVHVMAESMKHVFADRSKHLGDTDFVKVPVDGLISKKYAEEIRKTIAMEKALPSKEILPAKTKQLYESPQTNHFSIVDKEGNAVANTYTLNFSFGSKLVVPGTGFLLNNQMDDFASKPGEPNAYGLLGDSANAIAPGKRMLSSMTPTIIMKNNKLFLVTGSPGGSQIISTVFQIITNVIDFGMNIAEATYAPRIHHQWLPDELKVEKGFSHDTKLLLEKKGHKVIFTPKTMGVAQSILIDKNGILYGAADSRVPDGIVVGY